MGINKFSGESYESYYLKDILRGHKPASFILGDIDMHTKYHTLVSLLSEVQKHDFLELWERGYVSLISGVPFGLKGDIGNYLVTLTPEKFLEYYIIISKKREAKMRVMDTLSLVD